MERVSVRIKDIAAKAGVSTGTVDRVIHKRGRVSAEAEKRVLEVLKDLNYQPNFIARALGANKKYRIAVLMPDPERDPYWLEPYNGISQAENDFNSHGIFIEKFIFNQFDPNSFVVQSEKLLKKSFDGILIAPLFYQQYLHFAEKCNSKEIDLILFNTNISDYETLSYIGQDSYKSGRLAAHLLSYPLRANPGKVLIIHLAENLSTSAHLIKKEQGFRDYFENDEEKQSIIAVNVNTPLHQPMVEQFDALFSAYNDISAIFVSTSKAYEIASYLEVVDLEKILLVGFDVIKENIKYLETGVIDFIINQNAYKQGYSGIESFVNHFILKKEIESKVHLPLDVITKENYEYYMHTI